MSSSHEGGIAYQMNLLPSLGLVWLVWFVANATHGILFVYIDLCIYRPFIVLLVVLC